MPSEQLHCWKKVAFGMKFHWHFESTTEESLITLLNEHSDPEFLFTNCTVFTEEYGFNTMPIEM